MRGLITQSSTLLLVTGLIVPSAFADIVVLQGGETIEGIVREVGDQVIIELDVGTISVERASVKEIKKSHTKLDELRARREKIAFNDVSALFELALWANREGLVTQAHAIAREVLKLDGDHQGAHLMLGHRKHDGQWLGEEDYMKKTGHVRYAGEWMTADEARRLEAEDRARAESRAKEARMSAMERQVAEAQRQASEAKDEAERARREAEEAKQSRWFSSGGNGFWPYNPYPRVYPKVYPNPYPNIAPQSPRPTARPPAAPPPAQSAGMKRSR